jgi:Asp-tRNA(Asn)/Glu-tRNA(Gln) amidotransferase A subunit family amidase
VVLAEARVSAVAGFEFMAADELRSLLDSRAVSCRELTEWTLRAIDGCNGELRAFATVTHDIALRQADELDRELAAGRTRGPLHGIPIGIKDLWDARADVRSTFGSSPLRNFVSSTTSGYVGRLERAGCVVVGKTNAPEFGHKGTTDNYVTGATSTPFKIGYNSGGSSGGAAAAVGAGLVPIAQGTDGGGSIRIPAAWCGVFGFKPSFGRVADPARPDIAAATNPFVSAGPITRTVDDAEAALRVMAGPDPRDPFSLPVWNEDRPPAERLRASTIGVSADLGTFPLDPQVRARFDAFVGLLSDRGFRVLDVGVRLPADQYELALLWGRMTGQLYVRLLSALEEESGVPILGDQFGELTPEVQAMLSAALQQSAAGIRRDATLRGRVVDSICDALAGVDFLVTPTLAALPVPNRPDGNTVGPAQVDGVAVDPLIGWCLTYPFNMSGNPAASVPIGFSADGLPIGAQIVGTQHFDGRLLDFCRLLEIELPWRASYTQVRVGAPRSGRPTWPSSPKTS